MTTSVDLEHCEPSQSPIPSWPEHTLNAGMSCDPTISSIPTGGPDHDAASDYGSEFSPEEQAVLNGLLDSFGSNAHVVEANRAATDVDITDEDFTLTQGDALRDLLDSLPSPSQEDTKDVEPTDIEDYGDEKGLRVPKVLGKAQWNPQWKRTVRVQIPETNSVSRQGSVANDKLARRDREQSASVEPILDANVPDTRSPIERFRKAPKKALSVTDMVSPAWCEMQYFYSLSKHGRKRATPAMKQGSAIHKTMEDQIHTTVPVEVTTKEDAWGLKFWNMIQGLRTLRETGITRELEIFGTIDGEIINGIIDELSYTCPDPTLEVSASIHYANAKAEQQVLPEYQRTITDYLVNASGETADSLGTSSSSPNRKVYLSDLKTRTVPSLPSPTSFRPTQIQLLLYHHILSTLTNPSTAVPLSTLAARYLFSPNTPFTDGFIAQVSSLNDVYFSQSNDEIPSTQQSLSSQDSLTLLTSHNTPSSLYTLLLTQFHDTFPWGAASISPVLTAFYRLGRRSKSADGEETSEFIGQKSTLFDQDVLDSYVTDKMRWWKGERETSGVSIDEAWKCQSCEFRDECIWIAKQQDELLAIKRERRTAAKSQV